MIVPYQAWLPDMDALNQDAAMEALNVIPTARGYRPFPSFAAATSAITARAQGAISVRDLSGNIHNFCGDATKLYKMNSGGTAWDDVSRLVGGAYATPAVEAWWVFFQFGNLVFATNGVDAWQTYTLGASTNFAAAVGSPPVATFGMTVRDFAVLLRSAVAWNRVTWSGIDDATTFVPSALTLSDSQDLPDGGAIMGGVGGEYGIVFQERAITRMSFEGPPTAFRFDKITQFLGVRAEGSIAAYEGLAFFLADDGPYMLRGGVEVVDLGSEKWARFLEADIDASLLYRITSAIDPINKIYVMGYASIAASDGNPDSLYIYHWPTGKATHCRVNHEIIYASATQSGYTLEGLDALYATLESIPYSLDSRIWTGSGRLLLSAFNTAHQMGFFGGANLAATVETGDAQLIEGRKSILREARPIIQGDGVTPSITPGRRNVLSESVTYGTAVPANSNGLCKMRSKGRYHRARVTIPASSVWQHAIGISDIKAVPMGDR